MAASKKKTGAKKPVEDAPQGPLRFRQIAVAVGSNDEAPDALYGLDTVGRVWCLIDNASGRRMGWRQLPDHEEGAFDG